MKIFITGITGFVGSHLTDYLLSLGDMEISGLCRWRSPKDNISHCLDKITLHHGDLLDPHSLYLCLNQVLPDVIYLLAAQSYVPYSFTAPAATLDTNVIGTCNILESIRRVREQHTGYDPLIVACTSSEVYGQVSQDELPITEDNAFRPASPYAVSKVCEDMLAYQYWLSWKLKIVRVRLFSHEGPRRGEFFVVSNFAKQIAEIEKGKSDAVYVGNLDSIRTYMDVRDAAKAYWLLVQNFIPGEVYNIGGDTTVSIKEMLDGLLKLSTKKNIEIKLDPARLRPSDVTLQIPSSKKFKDLTGWEPKIPFEQMLSDTLEYWRQLV